MAKVISWTEQDWKVNLKRRLDRAKANQELYIPQWRENANTINNAAAQQTDQFNLTFDNVLELESGEVDSGDSEIGMNYAFKHLRFFHSQLSANPPSVLARPTSSDPKDRRKADAADRIVRHGIRDKNMQEVVDQMTLKTLLLGTGWIKTIWDPDKGDVFDFNEETNEVTMDGDIDVYSPETENIYVDPDANKRERIRFIFEEHSVPLEEAVFRFPESAQKLRDVAKGRNSTIADVFSTKTSAEFEEKVTFYEYYEKGLPLNGMAGRHAFCLDDGTLLEAPGKNPHVHAKLPYHMFTYIDVSNQVYGKSIVEYVARLQDMLNRLDSNVLDNIQAHGVARFAVHDSVDIEDESISNSAWDYIKWSGDREPNFINPPQLMGDIWRFREQLVMAIQDLYGINDAMLGIQKRETSAIAQQTSVETGTMIHRRLYKKYSMVVESIYKDYLGLVRENWDEKRTILVLGNEKAFEASDLSGADIEGGYDLVVEHGESLPLDPQMRREMLMLLMPALKEAGMSMKTILRLFKLNDLDSGFDLNELSRDRQREIFEEMTSEFRKGNPILIEPEEFQEHKGMLEYCYEYVMSSEFAHTLESELKDLIKEHIRLREKLAAAAEAPAAPAGVQALAGSPGVSGAQMPSIGAAPPVAPV